MTTIWTYSLCIDLYKMKPRHFARLVRYKLMPTPGEKGKAEIVAVIGLNLAPMKCTGNEATSAIGLI